MNIACIWRMTIQRRCNFMAERTTTVRSKMQVDSVRHIQLFQQFFHNSVLCDACHVGAAVV